MATLGHSSPSLKRTRLSVGEASITSTSSPRHSRRRFTKQTSAYPESGPEKEHGDEEELLPGETLGKWRFLHALIENRRFKMFFRVCAVVNIVSLACSAPFTQPCTVSPCGLGHLIQFVLITCVDFVLSILYTVHTVARVEYAVYLYLYRKRKSARYSPDEESDSFIFKGFEKWGKAFVSVLVTFSLWWSVAIGIYRSVRVKNDPCNPIGSEWYLGFAPRSLAIFSAMRLFLPLKLPYSVLQRLIDNIKWKLLAYVTLFYLFFIYMYAILGVQWIGGLSERCVHRNTSLLSVPIIHCNNESEAFEKSCFGDTLFTCEESPLESTALNINFRSFVYFGQFRWLADALFAVYEASSLELWSFMEYAAFGGSSRGTFDVALFYLTMVFFLVIFVQQSIFLVVIVESFADLRSQSAIGSSSKPKDKPLIVLYEQPGSSEQRLQLEARKTRDSTDFNMMLKKYYFQRIEKFFLILVLIDALFTSVKFTDIQKELVTALQVWQLTVSIVFLLEITGLLVFYLYSDQYKLFFKNPYYWYLMILAVGGVVAAIPREPFYDPRVAASGFIIFQALRYPRLLHLFPQLKTFFFQILGDGTRLAVVIFMTLVFLGWFAIISMQFFGYLEPERGCETVGADHFSNIFFALQSMFQLVMQEGWTELTSEVMCHRNGWWWPMNFYFIVLHLFGSLILLNFFVAVILDNLDTEEEKKPKKLEEELKKRKIEKIPPHLKLVTFCGPKTVSIPKLSTSGIEAPNLTEADVKNFYKTGEATEFPTGLYPSDHPPIASEPSIQRRASELSQLELLTKDSSDVLSTDIPSHHGKYWGIQGILSYVKALRQHSRDQEGLGGREYRGPSGQLDTSPLVQSEYDEYREKYRLFDSALFCMPPDHKLRKFCNAILVAQLKAPTKNPSDSSRPDQLRQILLNRTAYIGRLVVSQLPYFTWVMFIITWMTIAVQTLEFHVTRFQFPDDRYKPNPTYTWPMDLIFILTTLVELILKILANGFFLNPNAAIRSVWDVLDWLIVLCTLVTTIVYLAICDSITFRLEVTYKNIPSWFTFLLCIRALRPLRAISLIPQMRRVIWDVVLGWKKFLLGAILLISFMFMFASLGVQLFAGTDGPQQFCNDPNKRSIEECVGYFNINLRVSREIIPTDGDFIDILVPRVWYRNRRDFNFNHVGVALLTLFKVLTLEGWLDVRDMFKDFDDGGLARSSNAATIYMAIYLHIFVFFGVNLGLQLFVGIVVNNFNKHKPDHSALLTVSQKRWTDLIQRTSLTRPIKQPPEPRDNSFRRYLYKFVVSRYFRYLSTFIILLNSLMFVHPWKEKPEQLLVSTQVLMGFTVLFSFWFILEVGMKMLAFGPRRGYFHSWRNLLDFLLAFLSAAYIICAILYLAKASSSVQIIPLERVTTFAVVLAILKCFTILGKYSVMANLTITIAQTVMKSIALICVLLATLLCYAFVGSILFSNLRTGEAINYNLVNFKDVFISINILVRVMTGEDWHHILGDAMVDEPYCSPDEGNCGNAFVAVIFFLSYYILVTFIFLNIIIAVLLENFSIFYNEDDTELSHAVVKDFKMNWHYFDKQAHGSIPASRIKLLLRMLRLQRLYTYQTFDNGLKERQLSPMLSDSLLLREMAEELGRNPRNSTREAADTQPPHEEAEGKKDDTKHSFQNVLKMLAFRAEDICKRLKPQDLYNREELEESVQFDVAEACILKWMKRFVKPVLEKQEQRRRATLSNTQRPAFRRDDTIWALPMISIADDLGWRNQQSMDTEDESDTLAFSSMSRRLLTAHSLQQSTSEDYADSPATDSHENPLIARSYAKLQAQGGLGVGTKDKWHDWFKMQREWLDNVEQDPENYFDDYL